MSILANLVLGAHIGRRGSIELTIPKAHVVVMIVATILCNEIAILHWYDGLAISAGLVVARAVSTVESQHILEQALRLLGCFDATRRLSYKHNLLYSLLAFEEM